jgi:microcystin-dependent protein
MSEPFLGELRMASFNFAPRGWALCNGQLLPINQNQALFSLFGTTYGGNGQTTFGLPDLRSRAPIHFGGGFTQGQRGGEEAHVLTSNEMPAHSHTLVCNATAPASTNAVTPAAGNALGAGIGASSAGASFAMNVYAPSGGAVQSQAPQVVGNFGGSQAHENRQPFLAINWIVALQGIFPSQN